MREVRDQKSYQLSCRNKIPETEAIGCVLKMECLVEHDYTAQEEDELSLAKGDVIKSVVTKMDGWWEGTLNGKRGMFPDNFVKVLTNNSGSGDDAFVGTNNVEVAQMRKKSDGGSHPRRLKAVYSYAPEQEDELSLDVGDIVDFIGEVEEGWWRGQLKDRTGIFPSNFVEEVEDSTEAAAGTTKPKDSNRATFLVKGQGIPDVVPAARTPVEEEPAPRLPPKPVRETARCFYPYFAQNDDELTLQEGDLVLIISKDCEDEGWFRGELRGKTGLFPDNFVKIISPNDPVHTPSQPTANQPKVTAQERTTDDSPALKKERDTPSPVATASAATKERDSPSRSNSTNTRPGNTVVDGVGKSKPETKPASTHSGSGFLSKASIFKSNKSKSESFEKKGAAPLPFSAKPKQEAPASPAADDSPQSEDFNSISRGEKLSHLTANRAKAPRRRPPSAVLSPRDDEHGGITNGSVEPTNEPPSSMETQNTHTPLSHKNSAGHSIVIPDDRASPSKEVSPGPFGSVNKPKQSLPWMAELKQKQDRKSIINVTTTPNNVSSVIVTAPSVSQKEASPSPTPPIATRAPPLPAKPQVPLIPSPTVADKPIVPIPSTHHSNNTANSTTTPTTVSPSAITTNVNSKFSYLKRMARGGSAPAPVPTNHSPTFANHHANSTEAPPVSPLASGNSNVVHSPITNQNHHNSNTKDTPEFVPYAEHVKVKERLSTLETELELLKKQMKLLLDRDFGKGQIV